MQSKIDFDRLLILSKRRCKMAPRKATKKMDVNWRSDPRLSELDKLRLDCAVDGSLRRRFIRNPKSVMAERGIQVPEEAKIKVTQETVDTHIVTLPPFVGGDLSDERLLRAARPTGCTYCTLCTLTSIICAGSLVSLTSL